YREREDKAITVAFELLDLPTPLAGGARGGLPKADKYYVLAWTTTPWTLPSNLALAVNREMEYVALRHPREGGDQRPSECYILAKSDLARDAKELGTEKLDMDSRLRGDDEIKGSDLIGLTYKPLFPYFANHENAFRILDGSSFVTDGDGTGI